MSGCIYKISNLDDDGIFYIGSTNKFSRRRAQHKKNTTNKSNKKYWCKLYHYIRLMGGWDFFKIEILEHCDNLKVREQQIIDDLKPKLNSIKAYIL